MTIAQALTYILLALLPGCAFAQQPDLFRTIEKQDSLFFAAYNSCDLVTQAGYYAEGIEFFHDRNGLDTSKTRVLANTGKYVCGKVTRELVPGSLEISPLPGYGAVEVGIHRFHNSQEGGAPSKPSRFVIVWKQEGEKWRITKVISLH
ncbi:MAG: nuclear transport factor 2 family protein [Chitinophagaceae bacterium]|nr:MAG: nuclear transport factor 2 family protein [Chitinophagaceae bacterium]